MTEVFSRLAEGFGEAFTAANLLFAFCGVFIGTLVGVLPGIGPVTAIALLIPLSFGLDPTSGLILLSGIYYGSMYGGSTTSILIRAPGEVASVVTTLDGYEMAKNGRAGPALSTAAIGSFVAGTFSTLGLMLLAPALASVAIAFGSAEYFLLMFLALTMVSNLTTGSALKALISTLFGLSIAMVGIDPQTSVQRFTFGIPYLSDGIDFALIAIALLALPEAFANMAARPGHRDETQRIQGSIWMTREDWRRSLGPYGRGSVLGFLIGVLPGIGPSLASFLSYGMEKRLSKHPEEFGKGAIEGVAGPETANNAGVGGAMVPLFTLGIPGSATTALLLFVFMMYGLQPGPQLFDTNPQLLWAIIASMYIGNVMLLVLNLPLVGVFAQLLKTPPAMLYSGVIAFSVLGAYALNFNTFDMLMLFGFGLVGYVMQRFGFPMAPAVLALVLGILAEQHLRRAMSVSDGNFLTFVERPISLALVVFIFLVAVLPHVIRMARSWRADRDTTTGP
ncbi:MAG: tripartite tricarboxylate transporter permease [Rubrobacteraceae bacterium]